MQVILLFVTLIAITFAQRAPTHAIVPYHGSCTFSVNSYTCTGTGSSAEFETRISADGDVDFKFERIPGAHTTINVTGTVKGSTVTETGVFSFGIHSSHGDHTLNYQGTGTLDFVDGFLSLNGHVTGGKGAWEGVRGVLGYVIQTEDGKDFAAWYGAVNFFLHN